MRRHVRFDPEIPPEEAAAWSPPAFERAKRCLKEAQSLVAKAKKSSDEQARRSLAMDAEAEMT